MASFSACTGNRSDSPDLGVGFRPVQLHWSAAEGVDPDAEMPGKGECVIRVTNAVMAAPEVHASKVAELEYSATFAPDRSRAGWFVFEGICLNSAAKGAPECRWTAECGAGKVVVNFHNEL
ncbi:MAG: hypothetical protein IKR75_10310 [Fibrobacter sp.]|nr:hypothetical protein [Fibrobacter sp.]MBR6318797.1 hypothetical protein [Fibrobacter sp.]